MDNLNDLLKNRQQTLLVNNKGGKINNIWETAKEFCEYLDYSEKSIPFIIKLFRIYGQEKVLSLKSWLKDLEAVKKKELAGLIVWKLKENEKIKNATH